MGNSEFTTDQFRTAAQERFNFLETKGFHRMVNLEKATPTTAKVVYLGENVGFVFSLDLRDQCIDGQVVKVRDGEMKWNRDGGYSADIFMHLVKYAGYRGRPRSRADSVKPSLEHMIDGWANLLKEAGQLLLSDSADSLPK